MAAWHTGTSQLHCSVPLSIKFLAKPGKPGASEHVSLFIKALPLSLGLHYIFQWDCFLIIVFRNNPSGIRKWPNHNPPVYFSVWKTSYSLFNRLKILNFLNEFIRFHVLSMRLSTSNELIKAVVVFIVSNCKVIYCDGCLAKVVPNMTTVTQRFILPRHFLMTTIFHSSKLLKWFMDIQFKCLLLYAINSDTKM